MYFSSINLTFQGSWYKHNQTVFVCLFAQTEPCVNQDPGERSSDPTRDWCRPAHECPGVSGRGMGQWWPAVGLGALSTEVHAWDLLTEVTIIFITSTIVWPQVNNRDGTQLYPSTENWIKDLLGMPPIRRRPSFPLSQSLPSGSLHKPLILSIRGQTEWKPQSQKADQTDHMDHSLV